MKISQFIIAALMIISMGIARADTQTVERLIEYYKSQGVSAANIEQGKQLWQKKFPAKAPFSERSCSTCHGSDLTKTGKHIRTGKLINAMAPSVNPQRLTKIKKVEKWFKRNCKWTLGRECSVQEKANLILFINK
jgi:hypothetical protein